MDGEVKQKRRIRKQETKNESELRKLKKENAHLQVSTAQSKQRLRPLSSKLIFCTGGIVQYATNPKRGGHL